MSAYIAQIVYSSDKLHSSLNLEAQWFFACLYKAN